MSPNSNTKPNRRKPAGAAIGALLLVGAALVTVLAAAPGRAGIAELEVTETPRPTVKQSQTIKLITYLLEKSHYRKRPLDDSFSETVLDAYIDRLDPTKSLFVRSDIDQFEKLRHRLDDFIREGNIEPAFKIFEILRLRVEQRVEYALDRLDQPFDFARDEDYLFDREHAQWAAGAEELDDLWRKRIKHDILNLRLTAGEDGEDGADALDTLAQRYTHLARRTRQFKSEDVFQTFTNAYINSIEPHTSYFSPRASENFNINMRLSLEGIGAVLQTDNEYTKVRRIIPGGPADLAGELKAEDRIVGVGQGDEKVINVIGWRLDDVVELIRGPTASIVRLEILPGDATPDHSKVISIQRDKINLEEQAAKKRILEIETRQGKSTIGVIDLPSFYIDFNGLQNNLPDYRSTTRDVRKLLAEFREQGIDGLVIDLRGNGGGSLAEAVSLTGLFIKKGPVVQVRNAAGQVKINRDPDPEEIVYDGPLAVLIDRYSASASEIFAGAIQDYRRGLLIGEPTFGKGTVQHLVDLNRYAKGEGGLGQLKVTIAQFFRINGDSTQHRGVIPDIIWPTADDGDSSGERAYENAIPWHQIGAAGFRYFRNKPEAAVFDSVRGFHEERIRQSPEFQYFMEVQNLNEELGGKKSITLNQAMRELERIERDEQRLELENRRRRALGREIAASVESLDEENEEASRAAEADRLAQEPDAYLLESGSILSDYLYALDPGGGTVARRNQPSK